MSRTRATFFATCGPGLEALLHGEVRALGFAKSEQQVGGVRFEGKRADLWRANLELRTAIRVLWRLVRFEARDADALYQGAREIDWQALVAPGASLWIDAQSRDSSLNHSAFVAQRTKDAVCDQLRERAGWRPDVTRERPGLRLHVHVFRDRVTLSVDSSGDSLHKRGWRRHQGRAPLGEALAAGIVLASGWDRRSPVLDPFVGSGTLLIEAGLLAADVAPGSLRPGFAFEALPDHDAGSYRALLGATRARRRPLRKLRLVGSDSAAEPVQQCLENAASAGLEENLEATLADARDFAPRSGWNGWILTNPPYGERVRGPDLEALYQRFGACLREGCGGYHLALLTARGLEQHLGLPDLERAPLTNGGLECTLLSGRLEGSPTAPV